MKKYALIPLFAFSISLFQGVFPVSSAVLQDDVTSTVPPALEAEEEAPLTLEEEIPIEQAVEIFQQHQPTSTTLFKTDSIIAFMNSYSAIDKERVKLNYATIRTGGARNLISNIRDLRDFPVDQLSKQGQLAYWLNLRNLLVIFAVSVDGGTNPIEERGTFDEPGELWTTKRVEVSGVNLSIDDIERHIILPNWGYNPNIFYGLYQGSEDGPPLFKPGFREDNVTDVLEKLGKRYLSGKKVLSIRKDNIEVPVAYQWYSSTLFEGDQAKLMKHFKRISQEKLRTKLDRVNTISFKEATYNIDNAGTIRKRNKPKQISAPAPSTAGRSSAPSTRSGS